MDETPETLLVVAAVTPMPIADAAVQTFNAAVPGIVDERAQQGKHVLFVDMSTGYPPNSLPDDVHPNDTGYEFMAEVKLLNA